MKISPSLETATINSSVKDSWWSLPADEVQSKSLTIFLEEKSNTAIVPSLKLRMQIALSAKHS